MARNRLGSGGEPNIPKSGRKENTRPTQVEELCSLLEAGSLERMGRKKLPPAEKKYKAS